MAILSVKCLVPSYHRAGLLGWSLYYQDVGSVFEENDEVEEAATEDGEDRSAFLLNKISTFTSKVAAEGNDLQERGTCFIKLARPTWPKGIYLIRVRCFHPEGLIPLAYGKESWILKAETERLSCGGYDDVRPSIALG